ncbi:MAG: hypothetical protein WBB07_10885 [Mycobacterium sp.]
MNVTLRKYVPLLAAVVAVGAAACSTTVPGTPQAQPGAATSAPTTTTSPPTTTTPAPRTSGTPGAPTVPPVPTRTPPSSTGAPGLANTTCGDYVDLDEESQRRVISAIGAQNDLVSLNPELWISLASALCTFATPSTTVREVLEGQGIR